MTTQDTKLLPVGTRVRVRPEAQGQHNRTPSLDKGQGIVMPPMGRPFIRVRLNLGDEWEYYHEELEVLSSPASIKDVRANRTRPELQEIISTLEANNIPYHEDTIARLIEANYQNKQWLIETFGFKEENNWRIEVPLPESDDTGQMIRYCLDHLGSEAGTTDLTHYNQSYCRNKTGQLIKMSKVMKKLWEPLTGEYLCSETPESTEERWGPLGWELLKESCRWASMQNLPMHNNAVLHHFLCAYGDAVKNRGVAYLSINAYDLATPSGTDANCTFTTCIRPGGAYYATAMAYLMSPCVMMLYTRAGNAKDGRTMIYSNQDQHAIGRCYGSMQYKTTEAARQYILKTLNREVVNIRHPIGNYSVIVIGNAYIDRAYGYIEEYTFNPEPFIIMHGPCIICGGSAPQTAGYCTECKNKLTTCTLCEKFIPKGAKYRKFVIHLAPNGTQQGQAIACKECMETYFTKCAACNKTIGRNSIDLGTLIDTDGKSYCPACVPEIFKKCYICGQWHKIAESLGILEAIPGNQYQPRNVCPACVQAYKIGIAIYPPCKACNRIADNIPPQGGYCYDCRRVYNIPTEGDPA